MNKTAAEAAQIVFRSQADIDLHDDDAGTLKAIQNTSAKPWVRQLNVMEVAAVKEIRNNLQVQRVTIHGRSLDDGLLVVEFHATTDAMPYHIVYIDKRGRVAEAMLNQPVYHRTFAEMIEDTRNGSVR